MSFQRLASLMVGLAAAGASPAPAQVFSYRAERVAVPDNNVTGVDVPLAISGVSGTIQDLDVSIDARGTPTNIAGDADNGIDHQWMGDLVVTLISPANTQVVLFSGLAATNSDRNMGSAVFDDAATTSIRSARNLAPYAGRFRPEKDLSTFNGEQANGTWKLRVVDRGAGDTGGVSLWSLHLKMSAGTSPTPPVIEFGAPALDVTRTNSTAAFSATGSARDYDGTVAGVLYRVTPPGVDPATAPWKTPTNDTGDWSGFSFSTALEIGSNVIEAYATDSTGRTSAIAKRTVVRDEPVYNGPRPDFAGTDTSTQFRVALTRTTGIAPATVWATSTGMRYDILNNSAIFTGDVTGDGLADLVCVSGDGDYQIAVANTSRTFTVQAKVAADFFYNEYDGDGIFLADFDGDARADLLQLYAHPAAPDSWLAKSNGTGFDAMTAWGQSGFTFLPNEDHWVDAGDVDGDERADLVYAQPGGDLWVIRSGDTGFIGSEKWCTTGFFQYSRGTAVNPALATGVFLGDPNGDGKMDVGYLSSAGALWFAISNGSSFEAPSKWADTGFAYKPLLGFGSHIYVGDINADAMMDVLQIGQQGETKVAYSTGNRLIDPGTAIFGTPGFRSSLLGPEHIFFGNFGN